MIHALLLAATLQLPIDREHVRAEELDGVQVLSIHVRGISVREFARECARKLGVRWVNDAGEGDTGLVSADIDRRPTRLALEWALGAAGLGFELRDGVLRTYVANPDVQELEQMSVAAYARALSRFANAPEADDARRELITLERRRDNLSGALQHALILAKTGHTVPAMADGLLSAGMIAEQLGRWKDASEYFRGLSSLDETNAAHQITAREEMVRCLVHLEDYDRAALVSASLDNAYPPATEVEREKRYLLAGMALAGTSRGAEALEALAKVRIELLPADLRREATRALATALETDGRLGEAGKSWMLVASAATGEERLHAIEQAARLALADGDELGALLACSAVPVEQESIALRAFRDAARSRLGLARDSRPSEHGDAEGRILEFEHLVDANRGADALRDMGELLAEGSDHEPEMLLRVRLLRARALAQSEGLDAGLEAAREARALALNDSARTRCDIAAAELLEAAGQYGRAADAYEGRY